jgi:hypothetical protein
MHTDLLKRARASLSGNKRPRAVYLRRAVSDAYYSVFHRLACLCADQLIGGNQRNSDAWIRTYRGLDHKQTKEQFQRNDVRALAPQMAAIAAAFVQLQEARHDADYSPVHSLRRRADAENFINLAEKAVERIGELDADAPRSLAACLLIKKRS